MQLIVDVFGDGDETDVTGDEAGTVCEGLLCNVPDTVGINGTVCEALIL